MHAQKENFTKDFGQRLFIMQMQVILLIVLQQKAWKIAHHMSYNMEESLKFKIFKGIWESYLFTHSVSKQK